MNKYSVRTDHQSIILACKHIAHQIRKKENLSFHLCEISYLFHFAIFIIFFRFASVISVLQRLSSLKRVIKIENIQHLILVEKSL